MQQNINILKNLIASIEAGQFTTGMRGQSEIANIIATVVTNLEALPFNLEPELSNTVHVTDFSPTIARAGEYFSGSFWEAHNTKEMTDCIINGESVTEAHMKALLESKPEGYWTWTEGQTTSKGYANTFTNDPASIAEYHAHMQAIYAPRSCENCDRPFNGNSRIVYSTGSGRGTYCLDCTTLILMTENIGRVEMGEGPMGVCVSGSYRHYDDAPRCHTCNSFISVHMNGGQDRCACPNIQDIEPSEFEDTMPPAGMYPTCSTCGSRLEPAGDSLACLSGCN